MCAWAAACRVPCSEIKLIAGRNCCQPALVNTLVLFCLANTRIAFIWRDYNEEVTIPKKLRDYLRFWPRSPHGISLQTRVPGVPGVQEPQERGPWCPSSHCFYLTFSLQKTTKAFLEFQDLPAVLLSANMRHKWIQGCKTSQLWKI